MEKNPLTDPTSLIAYRLANSTSRERKKTGTRRFQPSSSGGAPAIVFAIAFFALLAAVFLLTRTH